jgi:hypothetical protein
MFHKLFSAKRENQRTQKRASRRCAIESIEDRRLMTVNSLGGEKLPPVNTRINWLTLNVQTAAIRNVVSSEAADGILSRNEMLNLFKTVEKAGPVTSTEFSDLKNIVNHSTYFAGEGYVQQLSQDVVLGNVANAHYLGKTLGNLAANSKATQLESLVDKWFLGMDHPLAGVGDYVSAQGTLYHTDGSISEEDVVQGHAGDCFLMASLAEVAQDHPEDIKDMIIDNGDNTYTVRFFYNSTPEYVTVDRYLPAYSNGTFVYANAGAYASSSNNVLWVAMVEKAYAEVDEMGWLSKLDKNSNGTSDRDNTNAYEHAHLVGSVHTLGARFVYTGGIDNGRAYVALQEMTGLTGQHAAPTDLGPAGLLNLYDTGAMITLGTVASPQDSDIVSSHFYSIVSVTPMWTPWTGVYDVQVLLRNPWGPNASEPEYVVVNWSQITTDFQGVQYV